MMIPGLVSMIIQNVLSQPYPLSKHSNLKSKMLVALTMVNGAFGLNIFTINSKVDFFFLNSIVAHP